MAFSPKNHFEIPIHQAATEIKKGHSMQAKAIEHTQQSLQKVESASQKAEEASQKARRATKKKNNAMGAAERIKRRERRSRPVNS